MGGIAGETGSANTDASADVEGRETTKRVVDMKIDLRRRVDAGDEGAGGLLHDLIVEETGLLRQRSGKTDRQWGHLRAMENMVGPWLAERDWEHITSGQVLPSLTRPEILEREIAALGEFTAAVERRGEAGPLPSVDRAAWEAKHAAKPKAEQGEPGAETDTEPDLSGAPAGPEPPPVESEHADVLEASV